MPEPLADGRQADAVVDQLGGGVHELATEGYPIHRDDLATLSPYATHNIKRFGDYLLPPPDHTPARSTVTSACIADRNGRHAQRRAAIHYSCPRHQDQGREDDHGNPDRRLTDLGRGQRANHHGPGANHPEAAAAPRAANPDRADRRRAARRPRPGRLRERAPGRGPADRRARRWHGHQCELEIPVTRRALEFVTEQLERHAAIDLTLDWYGLLRVRWEPNPSDKRTASDPEPGTWTDLYLRQHEHHVAVARSDWYSQVVQAVSGDDYLHLEVAVPRGPEQARWRKALDRLADAEKAFALGDDAGVFQHLKGVFEAVPGAKQHIFDALPDPKRGEVDRLTKAFVGYLNHGRHVMDEGTYEGQFPVDRQDAGFAIAVTQVILSYASRALAAARPPS